MELQHFMTHNRCFTNKIKTQQLKTTLNMHIFAGPVNRTGDLWHHSLTKIVQCMETPTQLSVNLCNVQE